MSFATKGGDSRRRNYMKVSLLALALSGAVATMIPAEQAYAQSTSGDIIGTLDASAGKVQVRNLGSGQVREFAVGADGRFRAPALPAGQYEVTTSDGRTTVVTVVAGKAVTASFAASDATSLDVVQVRGLGSVNGIDLTSIETRTTFTADQLNSLPVARNVTAVSLLTPGTAASSDYFGNASFGGASAAENSYYVNGFNVTNLYDNLSFSEVPYQAIDQLDVQTGGYGARYGFSTGGVTSVNIKRGTNELKGGFSYTVVPDSLREQPDPVMLSDGTIFRSYGNNKSSSDNLSFWASGPLIKDRLFFFALGSFSNQDVTSYAARGNGYSTSPTAPYTTNRNTTMYDYKSRQPYWVAKLDWYVNDNNHVEYTGFDNTRKGTYNRYTATYSSLDADASVSKGTYQGKEILENGGTTHILKWTSYLSDALTMSLQYGQMDNTNSDYTVNADGIENKYNGDINSSPTCPYVLDYRPDSSNFGQNIGCATVSSVDIYGGSNKRDAGRIDFEYLVGDHKISFGYSDERWKSFQGAAQDVYYITTSDYFLGTDESVDIYNQIRYFNGGSVQVNQKSWYIEDNWNITDNFMLYAGLRNDSFENKNTNGITFVKQDDIWQPRVGFTWDVLGNGDSKVFGSVGRYSLPIAANVALRAASASYYTDFYYTYTGGLDPVTKVPVTTTGSYADGAYDLVHNGEDGSVPNPEAVAARGLKPYTQDELILGYQQRLDSANDFLDGWTLGIKGTYRRVDNAIDDTCDARALYNAGVDAGYDLSNWDDEWTVPGGIPGCYIYNPGRDMTLTTDLNVDGNIVTVTVPGAALGPKAKRDYKAITLSADKATERWNVSASYTWSKLTGNLEGLVKSTNGQDDTGTTSDFDFAEIMIGADGYLFNDHRHSLKVFGSYSFTPEWQLGFNLMAQSGSPISCLGGGYGSFGTEYGYTGVFHVCDTGANNTGANMDRAADDVVSPVGSAGRTPWVVTFSPSIVYKPRWAEGLRLNVDVLNLFNNIKPVQVYETKFAYSGVASYRNYYNYGAAKFFNDPRYVRFQVQYDF